MAKNHYANYTVPNMRHVTHCTADTYSTEPTSMPVLLYSFHIKEFFEISNDTIIKVLDQEV